MMLRNVQPQRLGLDPEDLHEIKKSDVAKISVIEKNRLETFWGRLVEFLGQFEGKVTIAGTWELVYVYSRGRPDLQPDYVLKLYWRAVVKEAESRVKLPVHLITYGGVAEAVRKEPSHRSVTRWTNILFREYLTWEEVIEATLEDRPYGIGEETWRILLRHVRKVVVEQSAADVVVSFLKRIVKHIRS